MRKTLGLVALIVLVGGGVASCGDDNEGLSKAEFVRQGNAICKEGNEKFQALDFPVTQAAVVGFFEKVTPLVEKQAEDLRALDPPSADEDTVEAILDAFDRSVADFKKAESDPALASRLFDAEGGENNKEAEKKAVAYGMTECKDEDAEDGEATKRLDPTAFPADKRAFIAKADAICKAANDKFRPIEGSAFEAFPPPIDKWAEFLPKAVAIFGPALTELKKLQPPAADRAAVTGLFDRQAALLGKLDEGAKLAAAGDEDTFAKTMGSAFGESDEVDAAFVAYGFQVCGPDDEAER